MCSNRGRFEGAETAFAVNFEAQQESVEGVASLRYVIVPPTRLFAPMVVFACLMADGTVEIVSVIEDESYEDLLEGDPSDWPWESVRTQRYTSPQRLGVYN